MKRKYKIFGLLFVLNCSIVGCNAGLSSTGDQQSSAPVQSSTPVQSSIPVISTGGQQSSTHTASSSVNIPINNSAPKINGIFDRMPNKSSGVYNVMLQVTAYDNEDGDLTDKITYVIYDFDNKKEVTEIPLNIDNKYKVTFTVTDSHGATASEYYFVVIGRGTSACKGCNFTYSKNLEYKLAWSDEFDYEGFPDSKYWTAEIGTGQGGWGNNELQYYTNREENALVKDGNLTITLRKEEYNGSNYTSARLITRDKVKFTYGKFEIRAKMPKGKGTWPAFWALANTRVYGNKGWPDIGEIDFMETVGYDANKIHGTVHTGKYNGGNGQQKGGSTRLADIYNEYHVYTTEWLPDKIVWYVDGVAYYTYKPTNYMGCPDYKVWPFDQNFFMILNLAWGGNWGGAQGTDESVFDAEGIGPKYVLDYVRVYQSEEISALLEG